MKYSLFDWVCDLITGFTGEIVAINIRPGYVQYSVQTKTLDKDGKPVEEQWFHESRLTDDISQGDTKNEN